MKQYFTGFFTALCITSSIFFFLGADNKSGYVYLFNHNNYKVLRVGSIYGDGPAGNGYTSLGNQDGDYG